MLRILIPALQVGPGQTGVGTYTLELIRGMTKVSRSVEVLVAAPYPEYFDFLTKIDGFDVVPTMLRGDTPRGRMMAIHTTIPATARRLGVDAVFGPNFIAPVWGGFRTAVTVHDLTYRRFPETTTRTKRAYYHLMVGRSVKRSTRVFVSSRAVGNELLELDPQLAERIRLTPLGVPPTYLENGDRDSGRANEFTRTPRRDFLFVGTVEPRKNLARILAAHSNLCRQDAAFPALRVIGGKGWQDAEIRRAVIDHFDPRRLLLLGYRSDAELVEAYETALALVFPSLYEGFGLPVLEAMARGCPVLTSRGIATEEVAGNAALLVDPASQGSIEQGLHRLAAEPTLRRRLTQAGLRRVGCFSWERCARATLDGLAEIEPRRS